MRKGLLLSLLFVFLVGCSSGTYHVPKREYQSRVQVLGVVPILVDSSRPMNYPDTDTLYTMLRRSAQNKHFHLTEQLRQKKGYFDVRPLDINPELITLSLLAGGARYDEAGRPVGYDLDQATVTELTRQNVVDALLVVVLSGARIEENRRSRTKLESLRTRYSNVVATAFVVDREGDVLWEMAGDKAYTAVVLQYPDFDEAYYNRSETVRVKNITKDGAQRIIAGEAALDAAMPSPMYQELFSGIVSAISPGLLDSLR